MNVPWAECKSGKVHRTQEEADSCPGCYIFRQDAVILKPHHHGTIDRDLNTPSPSSSWATVSESDITNQNSRDHSLVNSKVDPWFFETSSKPLQSANQVGTSSSGHDYNESNTHGSQFHTQLGHWQRRNAIYESHDPSATLHSTPVREPTTPPPQRRIRARKSLADSKLHLQHYNEQSTASETTGFLQEAFAIPVRRSPHEACGPTTTLRASQDDLISRLRDSTFLVERLQTRETIALAERDHAIAARQRTRDELNAALGGTRKKSLKGRALALLLTIFAVLVGLQYANRKLYQPEFEWMAKMTREGLGLA